MSNDEKPSESSSSREEHMPEILGMTSIIMGIGAIVGSRVYRHHKRPVQPDQLTELQEGSPNTEEA